MLMEKHGTELKQSNALQCTLKTLQVTCQNNTSGNDNLTQLTRMYLKEIEN